METYFSQAFHPVLALKLKDSGLVLQITYINTLDPFFLANGMLKKIIAVPITFISNTLYFCLEPFQFYLSTYFKASVILNKDLTNSIKIALYLNNWVFNIFLYNLVKYNFTLHEYNQSYFTAFKTQIIYGSVIYAGSYIKEGAGIYKYLTRTRILHTNLGLGLILGGLGGLCWLESKGIYLPCWYSDSHLSITDRLVGEVPTNTKELTFPRIILPISELSTDMLTVTYNNLPYHITYFTINCLEWIWNYFLTNNISS